MKKAILPLLLAFSLSAKPVQSQIHSMNASTPIVNSVNPALHPNVMPAHTPGKDGDMALTESGAKIVYGMLGFVGLTLATVGGMFVNQETDGRLARGIKNAVGFSRGKKKSDLSA